MPPRSNLSFAMPEPVSTNIEDVNARGVCIRTFSDPDLANTWAKSKSPELGELTVYEVCTYQTRRRLYRPRPSVSLVSGRAAG